MFALKNKQVLHNTVGTL